MQQEVRTALISQASAPSTGPCLWSGWHKLYLAFLRAISSLWGSWGFGLSDRGSLCVASPALERGWSSEVSGMRPALFPLQCESIAEEYEDELIEFFSHEAENVKDRLCSKRTGEQPPPFPGRESLLPASVSTARLLLAARGLAAMPKWC